jgi:hypothetical protein
MIRLFFRRSSCHRSSCYRSILRLVAVAASLASFAHAQQMYTDLEARVSDLPSLMARTHDPADVLATSLHTVLHDRAICCGRDSALEDSVAAADPLSLMDLASKLQGRHLRDDGRPIQVTAEFWPQDAVTSGQLINALTDKHALLMVWDSHLYVVYGAVYRWVWVGTSDSPAAMTLVRKFLLWDTRFSDSRREVTFDRDSDDASKVQGILLVTFAPQ